MTQPRLPRFFISSLFVLGLLYSCGIVRDQWSNLLYKHSMLPDTYPSELVFPSDFATKDSLRIYCFGTSLTYGSTSTGKASQPWPDRFKALILARWPSKNIFVNNAGYPGRTSNDAINQLHSEDIASYDIIFIELGTNDAIKYVPLSLYKSNLETLAKLQNNGQDLIFVSPPPAYCRFSKPVIEYTRVMSEVAGEYDRSFINLNRRMGSIIEDKYNPSELSPDGIHFLDRGYQIWAEQVFNWLQVALNR